MHNNESSTNGSLVNKQGQQIDWDVTIGDKKPEPPPGMRRAFSVSYDGSNYAKTGKLGTLVVTVAEGTTDFDVVAHGELQVKVILEGPVSKSEDCARTDGLRKTEIL